MNLFSVNQVNQVYVAKNNGFTSGDSSLGTDLGSVYGGITPDAGGKPKSIYFEHVGKGGVTRSDLIDIDKIMYYKATPASEMRVTLKEAVLRLSADAMDTDNSSYVKAGYDFRLRIKFDHYIGISPEDAQYWKYGMVHSGPTMSASQFWQAMAKSILRNMSREAVKLVKIYAVTGAINTTATVTSSEITMDSDFGGTYVNGSSGTTWANVTGIAIREVEPDWSLGLKQQKVMNITVTPLPIEVDGEPVYWALNQSEDTPIKTVDSSVTIVNSKLAADYEYFFHGERGDQYRLVGWPDYIHTDYMVDPTNEYGYDFVQIHYYYVGPNEGSQKSEKDLTFLVPKTGTPTATTVELGKAAALIYSFVDNAINAEADARIAGAIAAADKA